MIEERQELSGVTMYLRAGELLFDRENYQRPENALVVKRIETDWDESAVHTIVVSRRHDGSLYVVDGQHRVLGAIQRWGVNRRLKAEVHDGLSIDQEARMFAEMNANRKPVSTLLRYRAWWAAGDGEICAITSLLGEMNIDYPWQGTDADRSVICWVALHNIMRRNSIDHLRDVLTLIDDIWQCERHSLEGGFITGVSLLMRRHSRDEGWDRKELVHGLKRFSAEKILREAGGIRAAGASLNMSPATGVYFALHQAYNKGRRTRRLNDPSLSRIMG